MVGRPLICLHCHVKVAGQFASPQVLRAFVRLPAPSDSSEPEVKTTNACGRDLDSAGNRWFVSRWEDAVQHGTRVGMKNSLLLLLLGVLTGCGSLTVPAAVRLSDGTAMVGTTTASVSGGTFKVATADGSINCGGNYNALDMSPTISVPVTCSDGKLGRAVVTRSADGMSGSGYVETSDGRTGRVAFGNNADSVLGPLTSPPTQAATAALASPIGQGQPTSVPPPYRVAGVSPSYSSGPSACVSTNRYGAISCVTGLPRTNYVSGYYRKNGTYVRPYYRSHR